VELTELAERWSLPIRAVFAASNMKAFVECVDQAFACVRVGVVATARATAFFETVSGASRYVAWIA
jgi:hypothetical protein